jgi:hypothetical protein
MGKILEALALLRTEGRLPIEGLVEAEVRNLPRGSTVVLITPATDKSVLVSVELLSRRGMRPVVVLMDAHSFGGSEGSDTLAIDLGLLNIPVCRVANGDDLSVTLSEASRHHLWA